MRGNIWIYIAVMALVSFAIRTLPMTLIRKPINNRFIRSFLYYVPYVTLSLMTFPAIIEATGSPISGAAALAVGVVLACLGAKLLPVAVASTLVALVLELILGAAK
ncbi:MAG: AzlD domain-containing protein [Clostridia bacterium]|nr:AzlD domain-containing protein [Clostridia bacterium]